jgi:hypothetical protein
MNLSAQFMWSKDLILLMDTLLSYVNKDMRHLSWTLCHWLIFQDRPIISSCAIWLVDRGKTFTFSSMRRMLAAVAAGQWKLYHKILVNRWKQYQMNIEGSKHYPSTVQTGEYPLRNNASRIECNEIEETHLTFNTCSERYAQQSSSHFLAKYPASSLTKSSLLHHDWNII